MSLLDSEAAFKKRVIEIGDEMLFQTLDNSGLKTFSGLAFACGTPQSQPDDTAFGTFAAGVLGLPPRWASCPNFAGCTSKLVQLFLQP